MTATDIQPLTFFTICAHNYLPFAVALGDSLAQVYPGSKLTVFLLDEPPDDDADLQNVNIRPSQTVVSVDDWNHRLVYYDILEFATSVKAACFLKLFDEGHKFVVYLDPDIIVFQPLDVVLEAFTGGSKIVLTPHLRAPLPADGKHPDDLDILRAGIYNLGFIAAENTSRVGDLLKWWDSKLRTQCLSDPREGVFTDQKWINLLPTFEPATFIIRHPGYNAAYWNIHERTICKEDQRWVVVCDACETLPLVFFHFSGFRPDRPNLSKYQDRFDSALPGDLYALLQDYASLLHRASFEDRAMRPVPVVRFSTGVPWDKICRALYRQACQMELDLGAPLVENAWLEWMTSVAPNEKLPRYLDMVLRLRPDIRGAFDCEPTADDIGHWLDRAGADELGIDRRLLRRLGFLGPSPNMPGVNYIGHMASKLTPAASRFMECLRLSGTPVWMFDPSSGANISQGPYTSQEDLSPTEEFPHPITILDINADQPPSIIGSLPLPAQKTFKVGRWDWRTLPTSNELYTLFDSVDELWVASRFIADVVRLKSSVPVVVVPCVIDPPSVSADRDWLMTLIPELDANEFIFLAEFDAYSGLFWENPEGTIAALVKAFDPSKPVRLILNAMNGAGSAGVFDDLNRMCTDKRISVFNSSFGHPDRLRLIASADAFVSLHRAEGFGLSIAEAMIYGKPVIATGWGGNTDFMPAGDGGTCFLFPEVKYGLPVSLSCGNSVGRTRYWRRCAPHAEGLRFAIF